VLTKLGLCGYNNRDIFKGKEEKSRLFYPVREPRQVRGGTVTAAEHGLGAGLSIGRGPRVIPLQMFEVPETGTN